MNAGGRTRTIVALLSAAVLSYAALAGTGSAQAATVTVRITDTLAPSSVSLPPNTTVRFVNDDGDRHRIRTTSAPAEFDSGNLDTGEDYSVTLRSTGRYEYRDERNTDDAAYFGTIIVADSVAATTIDPTAPPPPPVPSTVSVSIGDRIFVPSSITVAPGGTVTWTNDDDRPHTVTAFDGSFDSGIMENGATWSRTFPDGGTFDYFCELHPDMTGTVTVSTADGVGGEGGAPPTTVATTTPPGTAVPTTPPVATVPNVDRGGTGATAPTAVSAAISGNQFTPQIITIAAGGTVTWTNQDAVPHTVTGTTGLFGSGFLRQGDQFSETFSTIGTYEYFCELHPEMTAKVVVVAPDSPASATTQPPGTTTPTTTPTTTTPADTPATVPPAPDGTTATATPTAGAAALPTAETVAIVGNQFSPRTVTISVGGTVTWTNQDAVPHTVTATDRSFDSGIMMQGDRWSRTFTEAGTYTYFCEIHPSMTATVVVTTPGSAPPAVVTTPGPASPADMTSTTTTATIGSSEPGATGTGPVTSGSGSVAAAGPAAPGSATVGMGDLQFLPMSVTVGAGGTVTWTNTDSLPHTVTSNDGSFDSGIMMPGDTFTRAFSTPGTIGYRCTLHPGMNGTIEVLEAAVGSAAGSMAGDGDPELPGHSSATDGRAVGGARPSGSGTDDRSTPAERAADEVADVDSTPVVAVTDVSFEPTDIVLHQGGTVRWEFGGVLPHTVTADDGSFDSGILEPGDTFAFTFDEIGTFTYNCTLHPSMVGSVTVVAVDDEIPDDRAGISALSGDQGAASTPEAGLIPRDGSSSSAPLLLATLLGVLGAILVVGLWAINRIQTSPSDSRIGESGAHPASATT